MKVVSYCNIPQDLTGGHYLSEYMCGCYVENTLPTQEEIDKNEYDLDEVDYWISTNYPELIGTTFLIEIDY